MKSLYDVENTQVVIYNDENEKYDGYAEKLSFAARALDVASIVSPVSFFDICSAYTGKDCVSGDGLDDFDKTLVAGSLIPYGSKFFKVTKLVKNSKRVLEVAEITLKMTKFTKVKNVKIIDEAGTIIYEGERDLKSEIEDLVSGKLSIRDTFKNKEGFLPKKNDGYYIEYEIKSTPNWKKTSATPERFIVGGDGEIYYTSNHYLTFVNLN